MAFRRRGRGRVRARRGRGRRRSFGRRSAVRRIGYRM